MATTATRNGNTLYLEASGGASTIDALTSKNILVVGIVLTSGASAETLSLLDVHASSPPNKLKIKSAANTTTFIDLADSPIVFPNGVRVTLSQTDSYATLLIKETKV